MSNPNINNTRRPDPSRQLRWFCEGELKCVACTKPIPAGYFGRSKKLYVCSAACYNNYYLNLRKPVRCTFCRKKFKRQHTQNTRPFCCLDHYYAWRRKQTDEIKSGHFAPLLKEFLEDCAPRFLARNTIKMARYSLSALFYFLRGKKIRSLERVNPKIITAFLADLKKSRPKSAGRVAGNIRFFFDWMIFTGKRKSANPVIPRFHTQVSVTRLPRPYEAKELNLIRSLVDGSGDLRLRLAIAIGEEAGLRVSEVCNLRLSDTNLDKQELFVRLPTKTRRERFAPFHNRTKSLLMAWLNERPAADHDFLFTGWRNIPLRVHTLRLLLNRTLCGEGKLSQFSFHRLRHSAASKVYPAMDTVSVMRTFGWESERVMQNYTRLIPQSMRDSYTKAMDRIESEGFDPALQPESIEAYFSSEHPSK